MLLGAAVVTGAILFRMLRAAPVWYRPQQLSAVERDAAATRAEGKLRSIQNQAARAQAGQVARNSSNEPGAATASVTDREMVVSFSDAELNAFFNKWAVLNGWKSSYQSFMDDPAIALHDGRLILAAHLKDLDTIASLHFEPQLDENGRLHMNLIRVLGGSLPIPHAALSGPMDQLAGEVRRHLPGWQSSARIDVHGSANSGAICATMGMLLVDTLQQQPAEPLLFLPVLGNGSMAVKVKKVRIADNTLSLTVEPLEPAERLAVLNRIESRSASTADTAGK